MADVGRTQAPGGGPEPLGGTGKKRAPSEEFKKLMKVEKVREVDPEEKRKRRQRAEKDAEIEEDTEAGQTPKDTVPLFELHPSEKKPSPIDIQTQRAIPSPMQAFEPSEGLESKAALMSSAPIDETAPSPAETENPPASESESSGSFSSPEVEQPPLEPSSQNPPPPPSSANKKQEKSPLTEFLEPLQTTKEEKNEEEKELLFKTLATPSKIEEEKEEAPTEIQQAPPLLLSFLETPTTELSEISEAKKEKQEILEVVNPLAEVAGQTTFTPEPPVAATESTIAPYTYLHPQVLELFDRMVGVMTVMTTAGVNETTISLTGEEFGSSVFYGSQIIIREFSTAPREFNIQLNTTTQGAALFQANVADLLAAFQSGSYTFRVNRVDVELRPIEKPAIRRKEKSGDKGDRG